MALYKTPKSNLNRNSTLYFSLGLMIALTAVITAFEWKTMETEILVQSTHLDEGMIDFIKPTVIDPPKPPVKPKKINPIPDPEIEEIDIEDLGLDNLQPDIPLDDLKIDEMPGGDIEEAPEYVDYAEYMPEPVGGYDSFYSFIATHMRYPSIARKRQVEGKVFVRFIVDETGKATDATVLRGIGSGCDEEVLRVFGLKNFPKWSPGRAGGRKVKVRMVIPIQFQLQ